ncbi:hypothetical protein ACI2KR_30085 [Pseudomonas luteola]
MLRNWLLQKRCDNIVDLISKANASNIFFICSVGNGNKFIAIFRYLCYELDITKGYTHWHVEESCDEIPGSFRLAYKIFYELTESGTNLLDEDPLSYLKDKISPSDFQRIAIVVRGVNSIIEIERTHRGLYSNHLVSVIAKALGDTKIKT